jgi:glyoxylase-like metal-dependent hydrolase (beta-lactamase superfamily II)
VVISYGDITIERVLEFDGPGLDPFVLLPELSRGILEEHRHWLEPYLLDRSSGKVMSSFHSFVIRTPRTITVVDTCGGNDKHRPNRPRYHMKKHPYLERLAAIGVRPEDVDYVLCTHMHGDHVGQNTRLVDGRWVPTFPRAKYLISRTEWGYWEHAANRQRYNEDLFFEDSIQPVVDAGLVQLIDDGYTVDKGISVLQSAGHTPGHLCVQIIHDGREVAMMSGDLMHNALQVAVPSLNSCFCADAPMSRATRKAFLERWHDNSTLVLPAHFPNPTAGQVIRLADGHFRFRFQGPFPTSQSD